MFEHDGFVVLLARYSAETSASIADTIGRRFTERRCESVGKGMVSPAHQAAARDGGHQDQEIL